MKKVSFYILSFLLIFSTCFLILEGLSYFIFNYFEKKYLNYDSAVQFHVQVPIFDTISENGVDYYYSKFFPTRYYSDLTDDRGKKIVKNKTKEVFRIFIYGESSVAGSPYGHWGSFALNLEEQLKILRKDSNLIIEVMNFGVSGIGSTRISHFIDETIGYEPDLVIFYVGHNELNDNAERILKEKNIESINAGRIVSNILKHSNFFKTAMLAMQRIKSREQKILFSNDISVLDDKFFEAFHDMDANRRFDIYNAMYRANVEHVVRTVKKQGAKLLLLSQISNDLIPPAMTHWIPDTHGLSQIKVTNRSLNQIEIAEDRLRFAYENSLPTQLIIDQLNAIDAQSAYLFFVRGMEALKKGSTSQAIQFLLQAKERDPYPVRFRTAYKEVLQSLHDPNHGVYFIDTENFVRGELSDGILDGRVIVDAMHPNLTGYKMIAESILQLFFAKNEDYRKYFDFKKYNPGNIWKLNIAPDRYWHVCQRYFPKFISGNWNNCIELARTAYDTATLQDQKRFHLRLWEFLLFQGMAQKNKLMINKAIELFPNQPNKLPPEFVNLEN